MPTFVDYLLFSIPLIPSCYFYTKIDDKAIQTKILLSFCVSIAGFYLTNTLIPVVSEYTRKRGIFGKDLGKKGTQTESKEIPEALGIVCGVVYLICTIFSQLLFSHDDKHSVVFNSALFSICFMIFLGFTDDVLELKWRYKLILPTVASLPLLSAYSGSTAVYIPKPFTQYLMYEGKLTHLGTLIDLFATVDTKAKGKIVELGFLFLVFMGLLAVFCTNAINILAGINGLECGQSFVIASSILFFKIYELATESNELASAPDNQLFAILLILPFIGTALALLRHNWYPANVFVGDTFCYFAGMTFAVVGIHGHFSKTLLLLLLPQIFNFLYSVPQLFKLMPCPRHRLPRFDPHTNTMRPSTFPCQTNEYRLFKVKRDDVECPNCTLICLVLRWFGPMHEKTLSLTLLLIQLLSTAFAFYVRFVLLKN